MRAIQQLSAADLLRPAQGQSAWLYDLGVIAGGSILIALSAQLEIHVGFSPVPITGQTFAVLLLGALLGSWRGALAVTAYLIEGAAGLPVFAGGAGGAAHLIGPTAGYLAGFLVAAYLTGWLAERGWDRYMPATLVAMLLGNAVIYLFGLVWLARFIGAENLLAAGLYPFVPGDLAKIILAAILLPGGWALAGLSRRRH